MELVTRKMHEWINKFGCRSEVLGCDFQTIGNQKHLVDNRNDLVVHVLAVRCDGQVVLDVCNEEVLFE